MHIPTAPSGLKGTLSDVPSNKVQQKWVVQGTNKSLVGSAIWPKLSPNLVFTMGEPSWFGTMSPLLFHQVRQCFHTITAMINAYQVTGYIFNQYLLWWLPTGDFSNCTIPFTCISWYFTIRERLFSSPIVCLCLSVFYHYLFGCPIVPDGAGGGLSRWPPVPLTCPILLRAILIFRHRCPRFFYKTFFIFRPQTSHFSKNSGSL